jgi:hypothetical protein
MDQEEVQKIIDRVVGIMKSLPPETVRRIVWQPPPLATDNLLGHFVVVFGGETEGSW